MYRHRPYETIRLIQNLCRLLLGWLHLFAVIYALPQLESSAQPEAQGFVKDSVLDETGLK